MPSNLADVPAGRPMMPLSSGPNPGRADSPTWWQPPHRRGKILAPASASPAASVGVLNRPALRIRAKVSAAFFIRVFQIFGGAKGNPARSLALQVGAHNLADFEQGLTQDKHVHRAQRQANRVGHMSRHGERFGGGDGNLFVHQLDHDMVGPNVFR